MSRRPSLGILTILAMSPGSMREPLGTLSHTYVILP
eukprot:COSAG02_NODE_3606_length_6491_cov_2.035044_12_plen_35_part_01